MHAVSHRRVVGRLAALPAPVVRVLMVVLLLTVGVTLSRLYRPAPAPVAPVTAPAADHLFFADVEGWYRITRHERVVASPFDLRLPQLPGALPTQIGAWTATDYPMHPQVESLYSSPEVAFQRAYQRPDGALVWLTLIGHRGPPSFHLFEHTPTICYPLQGWSMLQEKVDTIPLQGGNLVAQRGLARNEANQEQLVLLYWYLWDNLARDPKDGILSVRISTPVTRGEESAVALLKQEFIPALFPTVVPWHRF